MIGSSFHLWVPCSTADALWNTYLGGKVNGKGRPFGSVVLDGIDMDIEYGMYDYEPDYVDYYTYFVTRLHGA
jgi:hypothetical protein